jgi:hypothetical protein
MGGGRTRTAALRVAAVGSAAVVVVSLTTAPASAFDIVGFTFTPSEFCGSLATTVVETGPPSGKSYVVPHPGVITHWSFQASGSPPQLEFKAFRFAGGTSYTALGSSPPTTPPPNVFSTFPVRIPVAAGDILGETFLVNGECAAAGGTVAFFSADAPAGSTAVYNPNGMGTYDISADVEPDADHDGYGDQTQDGCPSQATTHGPCDHTAPVTRIKVAPKRPVRHSAKFAFAANEAASFRCKVTGKGVKAAVKAYHPCSSPVHVKHLKPGRYKFFVVATDVAGNVGRPAKKRFVVAPARPSRS